METATRKQRRTINRSAWKAALEATPRAASEPLQAWYARRSDAYVRIRGQMIERLAYRDGAYGDES